MKGILFIRDGNRGEKRILSNCAHISDSPRIRSAYYGATADAERLVATVVKHNPVTGVVKRDSENLQYVSIWNSLSGAG